MEYIDRFLDYVSDNSRHITVRAAVVVLTLLLLVVLDNIFAFSYNYTIDRRISNARNITELLKDNTLPDASRKELEILRQEVLSHQTVMNHFDSFLKNISSTSQSKRKITAPINAEPIRNDLWHLVSSSAFWILFALIGTPLILFFNDGYLILQRITMALGFLLMMGIVIYLHYTIFGLIPDQLFGSWTYNYITNAILQLAVLVLLVKTGNNTAKPSGKVALK